MQHQAIRPSITTTTITYVQRAGGLARLLQQRFDQLERHAYVIKAADYTIIAENGPWIVRRLHGSECETVEMLCLTQIHTHFDVSRVCRLHSISSYELIGEFIR